MNDEVLQPIQVIYCGKCGMPPEYCEYGPDFETFCDPWLKKNHPDFHVKLKASRVGDVTATATAAGEEDEVARPLAPWTTQERLTAFYEKYQPDKVSEVPTLVEKYAGNEDKLFIALVKKYGAEPDDPYYDDSDDDDDDDLEEGVENLNIDGKNKRRGVKAKRSKAVETRVIIQKTIRNKKKATTIIIGMDTVPGIKLKDVSKAFSKRFAGSSSVKDGANGKEIIIQGNHMEDVAEMVVSKFGVAGSNVFLDNDGEFVAFK
jgi:density-regulated protein DRP1